MLVCIAPYKPFSADGDPYFDSVVYLHHFDAIVNGGQLSSWIDVVGNIPSGMFGTPGITSGKFSGGLACSGGALRYSAPKFTMTGDFTVEAFIFIPSANFVSPGGWDFGTILALGGYNSSDAFNIGADCGTPNMVIFGAGITTYSYAPARNAWHHFAVCRRNGTISLFVDGAFVADIDVNNTTTYAANGFFGVNQNSGYTTGGVSNVTVDEVRITNGIARYKPNDFTEQVLGPYALDVDQYYDKVKLLAAFDDNFTDVVDPATHTNTVLGNPVFDVPATQTAIGQSMAVFSGPDSAGTQSFSPSVDFSFGNLDFTHEFWIRSEDPVLLAATTSGIVGNNSSLATTAWGLVAAGSTYVTAAYRGKYLLYIGNYSVGVPAIISSSAINPNVVQHIAITREGNLITLWIDGQNNGSIVFAGDLNSPETAAHNYHVGYPVVGSGYGRFLIDELRVTKGLARYSSTFTPSAVPFTSADPDYAKVVLHCHYDGNLADEKRHGFTATSIIGTGLCFAKTDVMAKGAQDCTYLDGSTRVQATSHPGYAIGSADFTIEIDVCPQATSSSASYVIGNVNGNIAANNWHLTFNNSNNGSGYSFSCYNVTTSGYACLGSTSPVKFGQWQHIAVVRNGTNLYLFIDGVLESWTYVGASTTLDGNTSSTIYVGSISTGPSANARVANAKISKIARYVPTFALPAAQYTSADKDWADTVVLNHFDEQTVFVPFADEKAHAFTVTNAAIVCSPAAARYGSASMYCDGVAGHGITTPYSTDWAPYASSGGESTIEFWFNCSSYSPTTIYSWCSQSHGGGTTRKWLLGMNSNAIGLNVPNTIHLMLNNGTTAAVVSWPFTPITNRWYNLAMVRSGTSYTLYIDGIGQGTQVSAIVAAPTSPLYIGCDAETWRAFPGYIDEFRTVNTARYNTNFDPEVFSVPESDIMWGMFGLVLHFNITKLTSTVGKSFHSNNAAITLNATQKKFGVSALKGSGTVSQYAYQKFYADTELYSMGKSFTMDFWIFMPTVPTVASTLVAQDVGAGSQNKMMFILNANNAGAYAANSLCIQVQTGATAQRVAGSFTWVANTWYHLSLVKCGTHYTMFVNGTPINGGTITNAPNVIADLTLCADSEGARAFSGYIDEFRIVRKAVYPQTGGNFTPPAELDLSTDPYYSRVLFTAKMDKLEFCNRTTPAVTGTLTFSTATKKFGTSSLAFNAASYFSFGPRQDFSLASSDFTMEAWVYLNAYTANGIGILCNAAAIAANVWKLTIDPGNQTLRFQVGNYSTSLNLLESTGYTIPTLAWTHVAVTRAGSTFTMYINGSARATATFEGALDNGSSQTMLVGTAGGTGYLNGFIGDLSVNASARYSSNFTAPEARVGYLPDSRFYLTGDTADGSSSTQLDLVLHPFTWSSTTGNPCVMTNDESKYGAAATFDGGSTVTYAAPDILMGTQDLCLEMWIYPLARKAYDPVVLCNGSEWKANSWALQADHHSYRSKFTFWVYNASSTVPILTSATKIAYGQWQHLAITRSGNTWQLLINGVPDVSGSASASLDGLIASVIRLGGAGISKQSSFVIDDLRLTVGTSRYQLLDLNKPYVDY